MEIKPLGWDLSQLKEHGVIRAKVSFGEYTVMMDYNEDDTFKKSAVYQFQPTDMNGNEHFESDIDFIQAATLEEAKEKCKAHYERIVNGCIGLTTQPK